MTSESIDTYLKVMKDIEEMPEKLYSMGLFEQATFTPYNRKYIPHGIYHNIYVTRVPSGWIMIIGSQDSPSFFVPYSDDFDPELTESEIK